MKELVRKHIEQHIRRFGYSLTERQKHELAELYEMNFEVYDEASLSLYIEEYIQRCRHEVDEGWKQFRRQSVSAQKICPEHFDLPHYKKDPETFEFLISKLGGTMPLDMISYDQKVSLVESMHPIQVEEGAVFIRQGDTGFHMYILQHGEFDVYVNGKYTNKIYPGTMFGELALLHEIPRTATVVAAKPSTVWGAEQTSFTCIRLRDNAYKRGRVECVFAANPPHPIFVQNEKAAQLAREGVELKFFVKGSKVQVNRGDFVIFFKEATILKNKVKINIEKEQIIAYEFEAVTDCECGVVNIKSIKI